MTYLLKTRRPTPDQEKFSGNENSRNTASCLPSSESLFPGRFPIGIYAGGGASHSWLWFLDMFEKMGFYNLVFIDEKAVQERGLSGLDVMVISGGDTFAVAGALGKKGADQIRTFVENGGVYIGSCAGAYLPMNSSKKPLDNFNFVDVKITNLTKILPKAEKKTFKFCTSYGCDFIFHPVREEVALKIQDCSHPSFEKHLAAPLYGGPGMTVSDPAQILATYEKFTDKTSFLVNKEIARETLLDKAAVVRVPRGKGIFYLFGPHLEHPGFKEANELVVRAIYRDAAGQGEKKVNGENTITRESEILTGKEAVDLVKNLRRELSNSRIAASGLEFLPLIWIIGKKSYEPEKIRVFLEAMWKRVGSLGKMKTLHLQPGKKEEIPALAIQTTREIRRIKNNVDLGKETLAGATRLFGLLQSFSIAFFDLYFQSLMKNKTMRNKDFSNISNHNSNDTNPQNWRVHCILDH